MSANNRAGELRTRPASGGASAIELYRQSPCRARAVQRLQFTADACGLAPVFISEWPLRCEIFDEGGALLCRWKARP